MQRTALGTVAACAAAAACAVGLASPAVAEPVETTYVLTVEYGFSGEQREVTLDCAPVSGNHPAAEAACEQISEAGSIADISTEEDAFCTMEANPVTATSSGAEDYSEEFGNPCQLSTAKGELFDF